MTITCQCFHRIESMVLEGATNWTCQAAPKQDPQAWLYLQKGAMPSIFSQEGFVHGYFLEGCLKSKY